jgi:outer membrane protein OmpA-like peptidoglycan-associated protein
MLRTALILLLFSFSNFSNAQHEKADSVTASVASVNVIVTDMSGKPSKGEQILFKSDATQHVFSGRSDATGKFTLQLPAGDQYTIKVKNLTDTTKYGTIKIPALEPGQSFSEPFKVNIKFKLARSYTLDNVHFDFGKATLRPDSFTELGELVSFLVNKEEIRIEIAGHTDNVGTDADNLKLSQLRAETIRNYLLKKGIRAARVVAKGYGATQPVADNTTEEGRQLNRRTEVRIL